MPDRDSQKPNYLLVEVVLNASLTGSTSIAIRSASPMNSDNVAQTR